MTITRLGVAGWPVAHSRSPAMHNAALAHLGLHDWHYQLLPIPPDRFTETVRALEAQGFKGINVTIPHKEAALALADTATPTAQAVGAANTLTFANGRVEADNTDVQGLLDAMPDPRGRTALVLGAGGAARAAVHALLQADAAHVAIWNRTPERAQRLAADLGGEATTTPGPAEIVVNCTAIGLQDGDDPFKTLPLAADTFRAGSCVVDMVYRAGGTTLLAEARNRGVEVVDGLAVLVGQGAIALERWTGRPPPREVMKGAVQDLRAI